MGGGLAEGPPSTRTCASVFPFPWRRQNLLAETRLNVLFLRNCRHDRNRINPIWGLPLKSRITRDYYIRHCVTVGCSCLSFPVCSALPNASASKISSYPIPFQLPEPSVRSACSVCGSGTGVRQCPREGSCSQTTCPIPTVSCSEVQVGDRRMYVSISFFQVSWETHPGGHCNRLFANS